MALNRFQKLALESYADGQYLRLNTVEDVWSIGDPILALILFHLSDEQDCNTFDEAVARMHNAIAEIEKLEFALENVQNATHEA